MDMEFDRHAWSGVAPGSGSGGQAPGIDWHGLRARFIAAHACRRAFAAPGKPAAAVLPGSFHPTAAESLATYEVASPAVNPNDLADGKGAAGNCGDIAGAATPAIEGNDD